jgi:hypothetical protein
MKTNLMNRLLRRAMLAGACAGLAFTFSQAQDKPAEAEPKTEPKVEKPRAAKPSPPKVAFLGVVLGPVDESLAAQLDLPEGVGVLVRAVMPDSPAAKAGVRQHDVLHYFNDQLLVNEPQLQTLVRQAGIGAEVTLKLLRKGRSETVVATLAGDVERKPFDADRWRPREHGGGPPEHWPNFYAPRMPGAPGAGEWKFDNPLNADRFADSVRELQERMRRLEGKPDQIREEVERFKKEIEAQAKKADEAARKKAQEAKEREEAARQRSLDLKSGATSKVWKDDKGAIRVEINTNDGKKGSSASDVVTATADEKGNVVVSHVSSTQMKWSDDDGSGELVIENGRKRMKVRDRDGKEIFSGPVDTKEQLESLPPGVRERLERLEKSVKVEVNRAGRAPGEL